MGRNCSLFQFLLAAIIASASFVVVAAPQPAHAALDPNYTVTTTRDLLGSQCGADAIYPAQCSLRQALTKAEAASGNVTVGFNIPFNEESGPTNGDPMPGFDIATNTWTLTLPNGPLPLIDKKIDIDGGSQATAAGADNSGPLIFIDGTGVTSGGGLTLSNVDGAQISRLGIINFQGSAQAGDDAGVGIELLNSKNITIVGCSIGVNQAGTGAAPNDQAGIRLTGGSGNIIGGNNSLNSEFNIISGNSTDGILIRGANTNKIIGNRIGTNRAGTAKIPNQGNGIQLTLNANNNQIGAPQNQSASDATLRNTIGGNGGFGILLNQASNNQINGNSIGVNNAANIVLANVLGGIQILSTASRLSNGNIIGGATSTARNIIGGNGGPGILISGPESNDNVIHNNYIGVGPSQITSLFGNTIGVQISGGGDRNVIGGSGLITGTNVIAGNSLDGIRISGAGTNISQGTIIKTNVIGLYTNESQPKPNGGAGVWIGSYVTNTVIGGATDAEKNVISGNVGVGVVITGTQTLSTTVSGNIIGLKRSSAGPYTSVQGNGEGVLINSNVVFPANTAPPLGVHFTQIGGAAAGSSNIIAGNKGSGIHIVGTGVVTTTISGNTIGAILDSQRKVVAATGNAGNGVFVEQGPRVTNIRSSTIYSNTLNGVLVSAGAQRVSVLDTKFTRNGGKAISLTPATPDAVGNPLNANHDINPPFNLRLNQAKQVTGQVLADASKAASCITCTLQFFAADPKLLDSQGRDQLVLTSVKADKSGYFTATLSTLPAQLVVNATDNDGNSSEFTALTVTPKLAISNYGPAAQFAAPTESISYTFRVTNTGTLDLTDIQLKATSSKNWPIDVTPKTLSLKAASGALPAEGQPVVVTLTLPIGTDRRVIAGTIDTAIVTATSALTTTATASAQARTTVRSAFVLKVDPNARNGQGVSTDEDNLDVVLYQHALSNTGNLTGTVTLTATTDLFNPLIPQNWKTTIDQTQVALAPGQTKTVTVRVVVPFGATAGTIAKTTLKVTQTDPLPQKTQFFTDTTTVAASRKATISPNRVGDAGATETISFEHTVINFSNEQQVIFKLSGGSSLGSKVSFRGITGPLGSGNTFTVGNQASNNTFRFFVDITVDSRAMRGDTDTTTVTLSDANDVVVGGVQDIINVTRSAVIPRLYLPLIFHS